MTGIDRVRRRQPSCAREQTETSTQKGESPIWVGSRSGPPEKWLWFDNVLSISKREQKTQQNRGGKRQRKKKCSKRTRAKTKTTRAQFGWGAGTAPPKNVGSTMYYASASISISTSININTSISITITITINIRITTDFCILTHPTKDGTDIPHAAVWGA